MKKIIAMLLALTMILSLAACASSEPAETEAPTEAVVTEAPVEETEAPVEETEAPAEVVVMTHEEFVAAELETEVTIETYVQTIESWWDGACHVYGVSEDGGYYIYGYACTEEEAAKLVPGTKIRVNGFKTAWSGEVEIVDATIEIIEGETWTATALDVTDIAATGAEALEAHMNGLVGIKGMTIAPSTDANGNEAAFLYKWDGSGSQGDDLYFNVAIGEQVYTFTVNVYMIGTGVDSDVYKAVEALQIGDVIDIEGFLYWYEGPQTHVTSVTVAE